MEASSKEICYICSLPTDIRYPATTRPEEESYTITERRIGKHGNLRGCPSCGLLMLAESERSAFSEILSKPDQSYLEEEIGRRKSARKVLERIERMVDNGKILDIGSSAGFFLAEAKARGWDAAGIEFSEWSREYAKKHFGLKIYDKPLEKLNLGQERFDAVTMIDVIEHLTDPMQVLSEIRKILKSGGVLVIATPNIESLTAKLLGEKWYAILPGHLFYFSPRTLKEILTRTGFKVVKKKTYTRYFSAAYFLYRLGGYLPFIGKLGENYISKRTLMPINFRDEIEFYAKKN